MSKHFGFVSDAEFQRTLPKVETNPHKKLVNYLIKVTRAESAVNLANELIRPLPDTAQALLSTLFISVVPIFVIYLLNVLFLAKPSLRDTVIYYLISFAVVGLLGDVFFHTLPHLGSSTSHDHHHHHHDHGHDQGHEGHSHDP